MTSYATKMMIGLDLRGSSSVHLNLGIKASEPEAALHEAFRSAKYPPGVYKINFQEPYNTESLNKMLNGRFPNAIFVVDKTSAESPDGQPILYLQYEAEEKIVQPGKDVQIVSEVRINAGSEETIRSSHVEEESSESSSESETNSNSNLTSESDSDQTSDSESESDPTSESDSEFESQITSDPTLETISKRASALTSEMNSKLDAKINTGITVEVSSEINEPTLIVNELGLKANESKFGSDVIESSLEEDELYSKFDESLSPRRPFLLEITLFLLLLYIFLCVDMIFDNECIDNAKKSFLDYSYEIISTFVEIEETTL
ncbi:hypothetical protein M3Y98_01039400 [Aphelenchoides besseyi]|nr:hypothetical protein M3Y98_01039400 [Aphelenchoides besseyi]KAI6209900.1 hypothetical protein M3Y96_00270100 [Aphelenchoides besseyi]